MYRACSASDTPRYGSSVWYAYSVSQTGFEPASASSFGSVAIVIVAQRSQPPVNGVSVRGYAGYGLCAYASRRAWRPCIERMNATGETPPAPAIGPVTPPPTSAPGDTACIAA